ncbi:MAG TPA: sugar-binding transcriptional regulator [Pseudonocardia sp.]|uniref:sugar-binding transcriptional regulator n=1 Tax=Pseudonocardia sp. TaxID=60912 RepID=UPI002B4B4AD2|nr:sugar-binding transcriptional regulator [Pseudonocardia sp.]HLU60119.1 sugar-binding transcriptional regulator [Pseudonocardia sp.]
MPAPRDRGSLVKAARMYFLDGRSQDDIARVLGTSRSNVSRMLSAARAQGVVEIRVHDQTARAPGLEQALRETFGLEHVRVAAFRPGADVLAAAGDLAAQWLDETIRDGQVVGLSWGTSLQAMVAAVNVDKPRDVEVVPLVGGLTVDASLVAGEELVRELASRLGASYRYLHGPALLRSEAARDALLAEPAIRAALESALSADVAIVGIGSVGIGSSNVILDGLALSPEEREAFLAENPVGDTCCRFFDADGKPIGGVVHDRVLAVELEELRRIPVVVGVATGAEKVAGVLGALRGGFVDGLITDSGLAHALLSAAETH